MNNRENTIIYKKIHFLIGQANLICNEAVVVLEKYNFKRHYKTKHLVKYESLKGQLRRVIIEIK